METLGRLLAGRVARRASREGRFVPPGETSTVSPFDHVGYVETPSSFASAYTASCPGPIHAPPTSIGVPSSVARVQTRPPTRPRASSTRTCAPSATSWRAAASPA